MLETELEWLLYHLSQTSSPRATKFSFRIADTVFLRQGIPAIWYYTSRENDGTIKARRKQESLKFSSIVQSFIAKSKIDANETDHIYQSQQIMATSYLYRT